MLQLYKNRKSILEYYNDILPNLIFAQVDLTDDRIPVFSAAHPEDKYLFSKEV